MCLLPGSKHRAMGQDQYRRLLDMENRVRKAIDGADLETAFRHKDASRYDAGYYQGMADLAKLVYNELTHPDEVPF